MRMASDRVPHMCFGLQVQVKAKTFPISTLALSPQALTFPAVWEASSRFLDYLPSRPPSHLSFEFVALERGPAGKHAVPDREMSPDDWVAGFRRLEAGGAFAVAKGEEEVRLLLHATFSLSADPRSAHHDGERCRLLGRPRSTRVSCLRFP